MFELDECKLTPQTLKEGALLCVDSYKGEFERWGADSVKDLGSYCPDLDLESWLLVFPHIQVFLAAGTNELDDWCRNLQVFSRKRRSCREHIGYSRGFERLGNFLWRHTDRQKPLLCVGHSLGGAIATLAAKHGLYREFNVYGCLTIGSPRVIDRPAARALDKHFGDRWVRIYRPGDRVTWFPLGYHHVGKPLELSNVGFWTSENHKIALYEKAIGLRYPFRLLGASKS